MLLSSEFLESQLKDEDLKEFCDYQLKDKFFLIQNLVNEFSNYATTYQNLLDC